MNNLELLQFVLLMSKWMMSEELTHAQKRWICGMQIAACERLIQRMPSESEVPF